MPVISFWLSKPQMIGLFTLLGENSSTSIKAFVLSRAALELELKRKQLEQQKTTEAEHK